MTARQPSPVSSSHADRVMARAGLPLDPYFSASKLGWIVFAVNVIVGIPLIILIIAYLRQR